jgi:hypothetical protein
MSKACKTCTHVFMFDLSNKGMEEDRTNTGTLLHEETYYLIIDLIYFWADCLISLILRVYYCQLSLQM